MSTAITGTAPTSRASCNDVRADSADAPYADRFADADLARAHHVSERRRHRVGEDRRLLQRDVVGDAGQADRLRDGVFRPCPVVCETPSTGSAAVRDVRRGRQFGQAVHGRPQRRSRDRLRPAGDAGPSSRWFPDASWPWFTTGRCEGNVPLIRLRSGMADTAVCDLHEQLRRVPARGSEYLLRQWFWILQ